MTNRHIDLILIPSTLCNLRCSYCYELSMLDDKRRMSLETFEVVCQRLAEYFADQQIPSVRFIWHGGEPLLLPPDFYWRAFELQRRYFEGLATTWVNVVQTNLTVLDEERTCLLRDGFDVAGVSLDLFGSLRMNAQGQGKEQLALANLDKLLGQGVRLGGITVLTRANRARVRRIFEFYRERDMSFRILPLHAGDFARGQWFEISPDDTLRALTLLADLWLADPGAPPIHPVMGVIRDVYEYHVLGRPAQQYDKRVHEAMLGIDREGYVNSFEEFHDRSKSYGSLLESPLASLLESPQRARVVADCSARVAEACHSCPHHQKTCNGYPMMEGSRDYWQRSPEGRIHCTAFAGLIDHIEERLRAAGVIGETARAALRSFSEHSTLRNPKEDTWQLLA